MDVGADADVDVGADVDVVQVPGACVGGISMKGSGESVGEVRERVCTRCRLYSTMGDQAGDLPNLLCGWKKQHAPAQFANEHTNSCVPLCQSFHPPPCPLHPADTPSLRIPLTRR